MAVTAYKSPGTTANAARASSDGSWIHTDKIKISDNSYAEAGTKKE